MQCPPQDEEKLLIGLTGPPKAGKTTICHNIQVKLPELVIVHTDNFKHTPWKTVPYAIIDACAHQGAQLVEGIQVARAIRKGLPVHALVVIREPRVQLSEGQRRMAKGLFTILEELTPRQFESAPQQIWVDSAEHAEPLILKLLEGNDV